MSTENAISVNEELALRRQLLTLWEKMADQISQDENGNPIDLPLHNSHASFDRLCRLYGRDAPTSPIAKAFVRNGNAEWISDSAFGIKHAYLCNFFSIAVLLSAPALADGYVTFDGPFQRTVNGVDAPLIDNVYERYDHPALFGHLFIYFDHDHLPNDGDVWEVRMRDVAMPSRVGRYVLNYDAGTDCLANNLGGQACGIMASLEDPYDFVSFSLPIGFGTQCISEGTWAWAVEYNAQYLPGFPYTILPEDFTPGHPLMMLPETSIQPFVPASSDPGFPASQDPGLDAGNLDVWIAVQDDLNCGLYLDDELLRVSAEIVPQTNSHKHFGAEGLSGTGKFTVIDLQPQSSEDSIPAAAVGEPVVEFRMAGHPSRVVYTAGEYASQEKIVVQSLEAVTEKSTSALFDISVVAAGFDLQPLDLDSAHFAVTGTYTSSCDIQHNDSNTERRSHYLDTHSQYRASVMAAHFRTLTGIKLSYNDASLPEGGFFDNGTANREAKCHFTHRLGIDIDVNQQPVNPSACMEGTGPRLDNCKIRHPDYTNGVPALEMLDRMAVRGYEAHWWRERPRIHYRFPR